MNFSRPKTVQYIISFSAQSKIEMISNLKRLLKILFSLNDDDGHSSRDKAELVRKKIQIIKSNLLLKSDNWLILLTKWNLIEKVNRNRTAINYI